MCALICHVRRDFLLLGESIRPKPDALNAWFWIPNNHHLLLYSGGVHNKRSIRSSTYCTRENNFDDFEGGGGWAEEGHATRCLPSCWISQAWLTTKVAGGEERAKCWNLVYPTKQRSSKWSRRVLLFDCLLTLMDCLLSATQDSR